MIAMTKDDILRLAREAGLADANGVVHAAYQLEAFAALIAAHKAEVALAEAYRCGYEAGVLAEREECAKLCDDKYREFPEEENDFAYAEAAKGIAAAIRARTTP